MLKWIKILLILTSALILLTLAQIVVYRLIRIDTTAFMLIRQKQYEEKGKATDYKHIYVPIEQMPNHIIEAVIVAEDPKFLKHEGFDCWGIYKAAKNNLEGGPLRGASTINQQTVRNVFLWPDRTWTRKGIEAYYTTLINVIWDKKYLMEVYLNSIEMGENIYGIEAAAQHYYNVSAADLTKEQCAMIAAILPNPLGRSPLNPSKEVKSYQLYILKIMDIFRKEKVFDDARWGIPYDKQKRLITKD